jgi:uncharacterized membrane protein YidH (DUF202 family)
VSGIMPFPLLFWLAVGISLPPLLPQPESTMAVWCFIAAVCLRDTILLWWRTKLAFTAAEYVIITLWCALMAALYGRGFDLFRFPEPWAVIVWGALLLVLALNRLEQHVHPATQQALRTARRQATLREWLRGRHIPRLK